MANIFATSREITVLYIFIIRKKVVCYTEVHPLTLRCQFCLVFHRACERLKQMRIQQARPDPEKAAKTQELHRKLRVGFSLMF